jgi:NAD(P)-dependent dehydrogenase (short-subunit alcohol dehydrogenase family)
MPRVFITGSADGLGRAAARALMEEGHEVVLHARSQERASAVDDLASRSAGIRHPVSRPALVHARRMTGVSIF